MYKNIDEIIFAFLVIVFGISLIIGGLHYGIWHQDSSLGVGTLPFGLGIILILSMLPSTISSIIHWRETYVDATYSTVDTVQPEDRGKRRKIFLIYLLTALALLAQSYIGTIVSFALLSFLLMAYVERKPFINSVFMGLLSALLIWLVFDVLFSVPLPSGIWLH